MSNVRVRFAPSPTGFFHIGSARTALFNWLYARHTGGTFILRIEDTDQARNSEEFLNVIYDSLTWLGMTWDEGPKVGGAFGPYRQSERGEIYKEYLAKLTAAGRTYEKDGAIWFKLLGERSEVFDDHRKKTVTKVATAPTVIDDQIRGRVERVEDEDFVIFRSDGNPVFHFVNVVDDIAMQITHVIRGEDHLSNTSKHVELFKAFGAPVPAFAHIPLILKQNGPGKMSKRDQGALIEEYQKRGYLPEALVNFLSLLGWSPKDDREKMPIADIIALFDFPGVNQSNARFDDKKLAHMNMAYLLELPADDFVARARVYFEKQANPVTAAALAAEPGYLREVLLLSQPKIKSLEELPAYTAYFFTDDFAVDAKVRDKVMGKGEPKLRLAELSELLRTADFSSDTAIEEAIKALAAEKGLGFGDYQSVARLAVSGTNVGPSLTGLFRVLGRERVLARFARLAAA
ncbi:MAG: glutamate--tRNA ligase [Opitutus sp.]|nr:glutamate--tRNA ligase [Opitutus sp.]MCS6246282.1 glutamate--tRNA ligase [Opitutus sp.]MCS6273092.1 glutamate--tRNA ligase [Opitutus sp.]MCS6277921.1 glutamate--tRNA ligase [Opitutus sp.]MCS6298972.1 glutamate--tRNA ligase [Opitutus sp.]